MSDQPCAFEMLQSRTERPTRKSRFLIGYLPWLFFRFVPILRISNFLLSPFDLGCSATVIECSTLG
jgi:hypothetical protein